MREGFVIHWNGDPTRIVDHGRCDAFWRSINAFHAAKFPGGVIPGALYSFGACPHGVRYEAQGWNKPQGANGDGTHSRTYSVIAFIGEGEVPTTAMLGGLWSLISEGRTSGRAGMRVLAHNQVNQTACPGPDLTRAAHAWDRQQAPQLPTEDDMTDDEHAWLEALFRVLVGNRKVLSRETVPIGGHDLATPILETNARISDLFDAYRNKAVVIDEIAAAVVAKLPTGSSGTLTQAQLVTAVKQALREGTA